MPLPFTQTSKSIKLKFLFKISRSLSVLISGTFILKFPSPIDVDAKIRLLIDLKNLEENLIAIIIDTINVIDICIAKVITIIIHIIIAIIIVISVVIIIASRAAKGPLKGC